MVRKKLAMAVLALTALQADWASAVGLGSLSVKSALNQPLSAEIRLLDTGDLDPSQIKVQLATPEDFERAGVDRSYFLTNLKFAVDLDGRGTGTIRISTHDVVVEPYLNFVVEARWPNGRLLREFAVLLDPPTFSGGAAAPAPRTATAAAAPQATRDLQPPRVTTQPAASATADRIESNTLPDSANPGEHRVQVNQTLSQIAAMHRSGGATVQQTMVAIQRANPEAFINGNVNLIKSGAVLRMPSAEDAAAIGAAEAADQIATQTHAWRGAPAAADMPGGPQLDASQGQTADAGATQDSERLTIATPGSSEKSSVGEGAGKTSKQLEALRNQLSASQETLDSARRDNKELQSRLDDMERQVATLQRLISLKDDQLAALQAKSAAPGAAATPTAPEQQPVAQAPTAEQPAPATAATPAPAPQPARPSVAAAPKPVVKKPVKPAPAPEPGFIDKLTSEPLYWGGALAALALLVGGAVVAKKRREQAEEESAYESLDIDDYTDTSERPEPDLDTASISDDAIVAADHAPAPVEPEKKPLRSETGDAIAEADIYIAYGRYQQAVDLLVGAIDAEPERAELRVKLLEVYLEMRNRDAFRQQFMALQGLGDGEAVVQVKEMLSSVDGVSDWLDDLPQSGNTGGSDFAGAIAAGAAAVAAHEVLKDDEIDLDFVDDTTFATSAATTQLPEDALDDLELDLDLDADFDDGLNFGTASTTAMAADLEPAADETGASNDQDADSFASRLADAGLDLDLDAEDSLSSDLDDEELDLELNEEDLDFALRAMNGEEPTAEADGEAPAAPSLSINNFNAELNLPDFGSAELGRSDAPAAADEELFATEQPDFAQSLDSLELEAELDNLDETTAAAAGNHDFDLSFAAEEFGAVSENTAETDAPATSMDLDDLGELGNLDEFSFETEPAPASMAPEPVAERALEEHLAASAGDDFDFLADTDEVATKLDLARAYIDMGDTDGAKDILDEVLQEGSDMQKQEASELLTRMA